MRSALAFLTPLGGARSPGARTFDWFPLVGAALGALLGLVWLGADHLWPPLVVAAVVVAGDLLLTGMLHLDGLVDSADGLLPHLDRDRRLAVMSEPTVGAFGVTVLAVVLLLRFTSLSSLRPDVALLAALWCLSRSLMAVAARVLPYARSGGGLASAFAGGSWALPAVSGTVLALALALLSHRPLADSMALVAAVAAGGAVLAFGRARLGGYTGDVLGASGVVAETVGLLVAAARW